jgi:hypothetical protein
MKMQVPELDKEARRTLLKLFQNAISLLSDLWITASSIAETLGCPMERVVDKILWCSIAADIGPELGETNLRALLGELEAKGVDVLPGTLEA